MKKLKDRVAVITGAASGIGRALAERSAREGMKVVLADVEEGPLAAAERDLTAEGATALAVRTDVSKIDDVTALARKTMDRFGAVHLLCNNAGVVGPGVALWDTTEADWQWVMGVNLWGIIHGVRTFVPIMLAQNSECHIVNTASGSGLTSKPGLGIYQVTKHGVVTLSETLHQELARKGAKIRVSVLCPGFVSTRIGAGERNRPDQLRNDPTLERERQSARLPLQDVAARIKSPDRVADCVFDGIGNESFYLMPDDYWKGDFQARVDEILQGRAPAVSDL